MPVVHPGGPAARTLNRPRGTRGSRLESLGANAPLVFLSGVLMLLVLLPVAGHWYAQPLQDEMRNVAEPGRGLVTQMHVAIALQGAALRDYVETGSIGANRRYRDAAATEREVSARLGPLAQRLGAGVNRRYAELRALEDRWHEAADRLLAARSMVTSSAIDPEELYEELLIAAARLDESIDAAIRARRDRIDGAERLQQWLMLVVGVMALGAAGIVAWLGRRLRDFATAANDGRLRLERATQSRERLMRGIGHDLKNPLNAIDGHAQLLEDGIRGALSAEQRESVQRIRKSVRSLLALVNDMLELSRAESGKLRLTFESVDMRQLLMDIAAEHQPEATVRGHRLELEAASGLGIVRTDPERARQVLGNLVSNAIKYTPVGGRILLRARGSTLQPDTDSSDELMTIDVIDSGSGIPPDRMEEIFREFTRLETSIPQPGSGLGLAIARRVAQLLGGDVTVSNAPDGGAIFTFALPTRRTDDVVSV